MFDRYSEKARRVIFFARYEASQWSGEEIDTAHLLLGLLREDRPLFSKLLHSREPLSNAPELLGLKASERNVFVTGDMPLAEAAKRVLVFAAEESELLGSSSISTGHLLLGLLREPGEVLDLLKAEGLQLPLLREALTDKPRPLNNQQIVEDLRERFRTMMELLTPELEPAVVYSPRAEKTQ